jgi:hypothetical protein
MISILARDAVLLTNGTALTDTGKKYLRELHYEH